MVGSGEYVFSSCLTYTEFNSWPTSTPEIPRLTNVPGSMSGCLVNYLVAVNYIQHLSIQQVQVKTEIEQQQKT